jgi:hypothetical protein
MSSQIKLTRAELPNIASRHQMVITILLYSACLRESALYQTIGSRHCFDVVMVLMCGKCRYVELKQGCDGEHALGT